MVFEYTEAWKHLYDWQSLIAGLLAFGAGVIAFFAGLIQAKATRRAAAAHIEAVEQAKRLQATGVAVAVDLGLLTLESDIQRARDGLMRLKTDERTSPLPGQAIMNNVQAIGKIASPPILERNVDSLFMLGNEAGSLCLSLIHMLYQHDMLVDDSINRVGSMNHDGWPKVVDELSLSLRRLRDQVVECKRAVQPISHSR
jgi:hypothetical protein